MKLVLCPRCELNYITGAEEYCKVCMQEMRGVRRVEDVELCSICNENPVLPGRDVCAACLREMDVGSGNAEPGDHEERAEAEEIVEMDSVAQMDEILPEVKDDEMNPEYGSIQNALSLERVREDEEKEQEEAEAEEET
ncbi:MAG: hypothetical protein IK127_00995 [Clostridia bacterium]|nr:hypothetical protein [Clostridia bacterium]